MAICYGLPAISVRETVFFQLARVIVNVHCEQARSYSFPGHPL
ncbi:hypothetical protein QF017_004972 [Pseudomonas laurylsulfatiphila]